MQTRRNFLKRAAMLGGMASAAALVPESVQRAFAITPSTGSTFLDAEHIVVLMQENRSFDHVFGSLQGVRGFNDPRAIRQANGNSVFLQTDAAGMTYAPFRLDINDTKATWMGSIPHTRHSQVDAWNGGQHDQWLDAKRPHHAGYAHIPMTMGHYTREDLPFHYALADAFTICDQYYCGAMTSTTPNRSVFMTGTVRNAQSPDSLVYIRNEEFDKGGLAWKTFPERLHDAGIEWKFYQNELTKGSGLGHEEAPWLSNFGCNILENFVAYKQQAELHQRAFVTNSSDKDYRSLEPLHFERDGKTISMNAPKGDLLHQFRQDVESGNLPTISWLAAPEKFSDHPTAPWFGGWWLSEVVDILTRNPEVWKKTILIYTYDENDGYFDHAPSYVAADPRDRRTGAASQGLDGALEYTYAEDELRQGTSAHEARSGPIGLGFRVPMIVASPWTRGGWVNSQLFEHTSTLQFLETFAEQKYGKPVREENISNWRRAISGNLTSVFRPYQGEATRLPFLKRDKSLENIQVARFKEVPANFKALSADDIHTVNTRPLETPLLAKQEAGTRQSNALPYELYAEGAVRDGQFALQMTAADAVHGAGSMGSPFNVYVRDVSTGGNNAKPQVGPAKMSVATFVVKAGDTLTQTYPLEGFAGGQYHIDVVAPNGFQRSFRGNTASQDVLTRVAYEKRGRRLSGNIELKLQNVSAKPVTMEVIDHSYGSAPITAHVKAGSETTIPIDLAKQHGWYDFTVRQSGSGTETRYSGRVETGSASMSDPLMGNMRNA